MNPKGSTEQRTLGSRIAIALSLVALFAALTGGAYAATQIGSKNIKANAVKSKQIKDGAVKNAEIGTAAVSTDKLASAAVDGTKLADGSVSTNKLADGAVSTAKLGDGSVTSAKAGEGVLRDMLIVEDREPDTGTSVGASKQAFATCPTGYVATGGGGRILGDAAAKDVIIDVNQPIVASGPGLSQWFVTGSDLSGAASAEDYAVEATAICVKA